MSVEFHLPDVGEGLHEAEVLTWLVDVGDVVRRDQPFVEVLTDKSTVELPAPAAGTVTQLGASVGDIVTVGELLIVIDDGKQVEKAGTANVDAVAAVLPPTPASTPTRQPVPSPSAGLRPKAAPSTRRLAAERGIDLTTVVGTGPGGRILAEDLNATADTSDLAGAIDMIDDALLATTVGGAGAAGVLGDAAATATTPPQPNVAADQNLGHAEPGVTALRGVRRLTAHAMDTSWSTIPHITAMNDVDAAALLETRVRLREAAGSEGERITPLTLMMMAVAQALQAFPLMNATLDLAAETITVHDDVNIGVAVSSEHGLIVPVVRQADTLGVLEMAGEIGRLSAAARDRSITSADLTGGTFTVTNYGSFGGRFAAPIIRPGESGIMGFGGIAKRPMVVGDDVLARPNLPVVLACDHRLIDGDLLSAFHNHVIDALNDPTSILFKAAL